MLKKYSRLIFAALFVLLVAQSSIAANRVELSTSYFPNPDKSRSLPFAQIYVGIIDLDPEIPANQKQISVLQESGAVTEVPQPLSTNAGGVPVYNGDPVSILVDGSYSLKVLDKGGSQVYYIPNTDAYVNNEDFVSGLQTKITKIDTIADLRAHTGYTGESVQVLGYYTPGDGGGGPIRIWKTGGTYIDNGGSVIVPTGGDGSAAWLFDDKKEYYTKDFGAVGDLVTNDKDAINNALSENAITEHRISSKLDSQLTYEDDPVLIDGRLGLIKGLSDRGTLSFQNNTSVQIEGLEITRDPVDTSDVDHLLELVDVGKGLLRDLDISGISGTGSCVLAFSVGDATPLNDLTFDNITVSGDISKSLNTNGTLIEDGYRCIQQNIRADGIREFAVEYKNETRSSILNNIIATNSKTGIAYGQSTATTEDVSYCAASNAVLNGCDRGVVIGDAKYNAFSNIVVNTDGSPGTAGTAQTGYRLTGESNYNTATGLLFTGSNMTEPVRFGGDNNFVSAAFFTPSSNYVILEAGVETNVTEVNHPGDKTTILSSIGDTSGQPISGATSNPVYCHATGEYRGILSDRWRYIYDDPGVSPSSTHRKTLEGTGEFYEAVIGDGTGPIGYAIKTPVGTYNLSIPVAGDYMSLIGPTWGVRSYASTFRPNSDGAMDLGTGSNRYRTVYATSGTINTSDEREKQQIEDIPESWIVAARNIKPKRFKFNDAVAEKGESARWHVGYIAQQVFQTLLDAGVEDPWECAFLCKDALTEELDSGEVVPLIDEETGLQKDRWGLRYSELLVLKDAARDI